MRFIPAHESLGAGPRVAFVLHGILGNRRNWKGFSKALLDRLPGWRIVLVDHRCHGESEGAPPPHTVEACVDDLLALVESTGLAPEVVVGHSFGGKVALRLAVRRPPGLAQAWALDSAPGGEAGPMPEDHEVLRVFRGLSRIELPLASRGAAVDAVLRVGLPRSIANWMTTNLRRDPDGFRWTFELAEAEQLLRDYRRTDAWEALESRDPAAPRTHVVRAGRSDRWGGERLRRLDELPAGAAGRLHVLPDAGHWLHVDDPDGLRAILLEHWPS